MQYRPLGRTGLKVSSLVLGTDNLANPTPEAESLAMLDAAVAGGINLIDTSNSYAGGQAERLIGKWLVQRQRRDDVLIATKVFYPTGPGINERGLSRNHIVKACEDSLRRLGTDYIDLYQTHRPDPQTPIEETLAALDLLVRQGKVRYIGTSTSPAWQLAQAQHVSTALGLAHFVSEQSPYNLLERRVENELVPACQRYGLALFTWSPMAMGMLAGRYAVGNAPAQDSRAGLRGGIYAERVTERAIALGVQFSALARAHGHDPAQLAYLWVKDQVGVTAPIIGPRTLAQLQQALPVGDMALPADIRVACDALVPPGGVVASFFNSAAWMRCKHV
jgi:aryl-alcohol dehydrogenase-like predicted oxidoreductase